MRTRLMLLPLLALTLFAGPSHNAGPVPADTPCEGLGLCFVYHDLDIWHDLAMESGASLNRWQLSWYEVETTKGQFDFDKFDRRVAIDQETGLTVHAILAGTPDWAATKGTTLAPRIQAEVKEEPWTVRAMGQASTSASPPANLHLPWDHPDNHWGRFVYRTVSHFKGRIQVWEMWNEEDWSFFWTGSTEDYYQLLKVAYLAAKEADPSCTVLFGGLHLFADPDFFQLVLDLALEDPTADENGYYFDALPLHLYSRSSQTYDNVAWVRWRMRTKGIDKPIWINETGAPVWNDGIGPGYQYEWSVTRDEQAAYLVQAYANALAAGVPRFLVFRLHDASMSEAFGIVRDDLVLRPAFEAYRTIQSVLPTPTWATRRQSGGNVIVTLYGTEKGKVTVLWNERPVASTHRLPAVMDEALLVNKAGQVHAIRPQDGAYVLFLAGATASRPPDRSDYFVGGDPVIIVEPDTLAPTASAHELPAVVEKTSFLVEWSGNDDASGVWSYDVQVRDGKRASWQNWLAWTAQTQGTFEGQNGHTYQFRVRARDWAGNLGSYPDGPQAWTTVRLPPTPIPTPSSTTTPTSTPIATPTPTWTAPPATSTPTPIVPIATSTATPWPTVTPAPISPTPTEPVPSCSELAVNGGFERDDGWSIDTTPHQARYTTAVARTGSRSLQLGILDPDENRFSYSSVEQRFQIPAGLDAVLSLWYRMPASGGARDYAYILIRPDGHAWRLLHLARQEVKNWTFVQEDVSAYAGKSFWLRLGVRNDGAADSAVAVMYVDDVSLRGCKR